MCVQTGTGNHKFKSYYCVLEYTRFSTNYCDCMTTKTVNVRAFYGLAL